MAQATRIVVVDVIEGRALRQDLEELVDLFLVLGQRVTDFRVTQRERHLGRYRVLVERHGNRAEALRGSDRGIDAWTIGANEGEVAAAGEPGVGQAAGQEAHLVGILAPGPGLPDAEI